MADRHWIVVERQGGVLYVRSFAGERDCAEWERSERAWARENRVDNEIHTLLAPDAPTLVLQNPKIFGVHEPLEELLRLILEEMPAATNRDLAADGGVGDEEEGVWQRIVKAAERVRDA